MDPIVRFENVRKAGWVRGERARGHPRRGRHRVRARDCAAELTTNAVKYAFPPPRSGTIFAEARRGAPERLEVSIRDDGVGMASFREGSLGYGLVRSLVEQINGNIAVQSDPGLTVTVSSPAPPTLSG